MRHDDYEHMPVGIEEFVRSTKYLNASTEVWENIQNQLIRLFNKPIDEIEFSSYTEFVYDGGIGSGKSFVTSVIFAYVIYRLLCFKNPQKMYGLSKGSTIALLNMSKSAMQARKVVFSEIKARIENSPWFQKHALPDPNIQSELRFEKNIVVIPGNSQESFPLGYNVILANMDEASFYTDTEDHDVAEEIFNALSRRLSSRFGDAGLLCITSSPRYVDDFTEKKVEESTTNTKILAIRMATWQSHPSDLIAIESGNTFTAINPYTGEETKIPRKYETAFTRNPMKAWRDFGAIPSLVLEPFFHEEIMKLETIMNRAYNPSFGNGIVYYAHVDLGLRRDACGLAIGHIENGKACIDIIKRIVSRQRAEQTPHDEIIGNTEVDFDGVRDFLRNFANKGNALKIISYDSWQSIDSRQTLEREGFLTKVISLDKDTIGYDTLKSLINTDRFECVKHEYFLNECRRLELVKGKKVDHPPNGSKDCADAVAGVVRSMLEDLDVETEQIELVYDPSVRIEVTPQI